MKWWRPVLAGLGVVALVAVVLVVARIYGVPGVSDLRRLTAEAGPWAPLLFLGLQAGLCVAPVPRTVFTLAAGVLFGSAVGLVVTLAATTLAGVLAYFLVRATGGALVERYVRGSAVTWVRRRLDHHGTLAVTSMRLVPLVPFAALNYVCGLSRVRFVPYLLGTVVGIIPGTVAIVVLGDAVSGRPSPALVAVSVVCGLIGLAGIVVAARKPIPEEVPSEETQQAR
ncbi:TVP38/TMEM64 family protein [Pseudonocardia halophobica]|uniref:TVP38/TMEM64 family protein n=1 Tax=Pseudonocardia halophobica TaxID=29401 RepID=UPI00068E8CA2|nr:TVP38/TMEM64 family protein [Pseudonocardia halophobica]